MFFSFALLNIYAQDDYDDLDNVEYYSFETDSIKVDSSFVELRQLPKNFKAKYDDNDFDYGEREVVSISFWERFKRWLIQMLVRLFGSTPEGTGTALVWIFRILGISLILFVLYKILLMLINKDGNWIFGRSSDTLIIEASDIEQNIHSTNFKVLIDEALEKNDFRLAIRYHYLQVLKELSTKGKIEWDAEKTNYDYYNELKNIKTKEQFQYISYIYDYSWYGEFDINETDYKKAALAFNKLQDNNG